MISQVQKKIKPVQVSGQKQQIKKSIFKTTQVIFFFIKLFIYGGKNVFFSLCVSQAHLRYMYLICLVTSSAFRQKCMCDTIN